MPKSIIYKIIVGGSSGCGKSSFLESQLFTDNEPHIGVSFKLIDCLINGNDSYVFQIWDLKGIGKFKFLYPTFSLGAKGALLCFDLSNRQSFEELPRWIKMCREVNNDMPIMIIGTKKDLEWDMTEEEIKHFRRVYKIDDIYFTSVYQEDIQDIKEQVFRHLIEKMDFTVDIEKLTILLPEYDEDLKNFLTYFAECPICHSTNHQSHLKHFFYDQNPVTRELKQRLMELMEESRDFDCMYFNKINLGIPCCNCYREYFK